MGYATWVEGFRFDARGHSAWSGPVDVFPAEMASCTKYGIYFVCTREGHEYGSWIFCRAAGEMLELFRASRELK